MSETNSGLASINSIKCHFLREYIYIPEYTTGQKTVDPKIHISVAVNSKEDKQSVLRLTACGDKIINLIIHYLERNTQIEIAYDFTHRKIINFWETKDLEDEDLPVPGF